MKTTMGVYVPMHSQKKQGLKHNIPHGWPPLLWNHTANYNTMRSPPREQMSPTFLSLFTQITSN